MFKIHRKLFDRKGNVIMKDRIVRGIFFGVSVLLIALFISEIGTGRSNLWLAVAWYVLILLPMVYLRLRSLELNPAMMVLGATPFTLFLLCIYLTFVSSDADQRGKIQVIK